MKTCKICNAEKDNSNFYSRWLKCKACLSIENKQKYLDNTEKIKASSKASKKKNIENTRRLNRYFQKKYTQELHDLYIKAKLCMWDAPKELIELKRVQLQLKRKIKNEKHT